MSGHKRTTSSVLKSIVPKGHQRKPSSKTKGVPLNDTVEIYGDHTSFQNPMRPQDHPVTRHHFFEDGGPRKHVLTAPRKFKEDRRENTRHLESLNAEFVSNKSPNKRSDKQDKKMKKSKSATSLSALFSRPKSSKGSKSEDERRHHDKENTTPPSSASAARPPIWAQFATQQPQEEQVTTTVPLNDSQSLDEGVPRCKSRDYSPSKPMDFKELEKPTLSRRPGMKPRPKSECITPSATAGSFSDTIAGLRRSSRDKNSRGRSDLRDNTAKWADDSFSDHVQLKNDCNVNAGYPKSDANDLERGSRVMAAVAVFNSKAKDQPKEATSETRCAQMDPKEIEAAFENLLEARNIPQITREKMRSLDTNMKADFVSKDKFGSGPASSADGISQQSSRLNKGKRSQTDDGALHVGDESESLGLAETPKKLRPRSRTFTFSKGDQSPSKKQKSERPTSHSRIKSGELTKSSSSKLLKPSGGDVGSSLFGRSNRSGLPEEYIGYLRKMQKPELVEVGKIHKLRQLLRNETVGWVESFIAQDGMTELVALLHRIINVEWREEHEDQLLHETLRCLKGLSTTSSALHQLSAIQSTLFPTLLGMIFDKEKKGPSEFTTRGFIISLFSTYLTHSQSDDLPTRARTLLSYLRDPRAPEDALPPQFITCIYHPRPYRIWNTELANVIKEVFWIFLHHCTIIPLPTLLDTANTTYTDRHFPREHPPMPAAPYIGGVEWDATNYLTAHIDLMNGLIASLPTKDERNQLRQELKDSGFERAMGASLRTCKEKFYGCVHEALSTWVGAAREDEWGWQDVRQGPKTEERKTASPKKGSPTKKDAAPRLEMPKLEFGVGSGDGVGAKGEGGWL